VLQPQNAENRAKPCTVGKPSTGRWTLTALNAKNRRSLHGAIRKDGGKKGHHCRLQRLLAQISAAVKRSVLCQDDCFKKMA